MSFEFLLSIAAETASAMLCLMLFAASFATPKPLDRPWHRQPKRLMQISLLCCGLLSGLSAISGAISGLNDLPGDWEWLSPPSYVVLESLRSWSGLFGFYVLHAYANTMINTEWRPKRTLYLFAGIAIISPLVFAYQYTSPGDDENLLFILFYILFMILYLVSTTWIATTLPLRDYRRIGGFLSNTPDLNLERQQWLGRFRMLWLGFVVMFFIVVVWSITSIFVTAYGFSGTRFSGVQFVWTACFAFTGILSRGVFLGPEFDGQTKAAAKKATQPLGEAEQAAMARLLTKADGVLEDLYLDPNLTVGKLAHAVSVPDHRLSSALNAYRGLNFFGYVNLRRIEEAKRLLNETERSVTEIGYACGFNSKSTFYTAFKGLTGQTPSTFRENPPN